MRGIREGDDHNTVGTWPPQNEKMAHTPRPKIFHGTMSWGDGKNGGGVEVGERGRMGVVGSGIIRKDKAVTIERRGDLEH